MIEQMTDSQLMLEIVRGQSSDAFTVIVRRYVNLVYGTAWRMVGDVQPLSLSS